jgi:hypothetical protein
VKNLIVSNFLALIESKKQHKKTQGNNLKTWVQNVPSTVKGGSFIAPYFKGYQFPFYHSN